MSSSCATGSWVETVFTLEELLDLDADEMAQLEEIRGDLQLTAAWWRRRRAEEPGR